MENTTQQPEQGTKVDAKPFEPAHNKNVGMAVVAYILFFIPLLTDAKNDTFVKYHVKQGFVLFVTWLLVYILIQVLFGSIVSFSMLGMYALLSNVAFIGLIVLAILGIIHASKGEEKPLPLIGQFSQHVTFL